MEQSNGCGSDFRQRMLSIDSRFRSVNMEHDMMTGVFRQVERDREGERERERGRERKGPGLNSGSKRVFRCWPV